MSKTWNKLYVANLYPVFCIYNLGDVILKDQFLPPIFYQGYAGTQLRYYENL